MTDANKIKFAAIIEAAKQKEAAKIARGKYTPPAAKTTPPAPTPAPDKITPPPAPQTAKQAIIAAAVIPTPAPDAASLATMKNFRIVWHEGTGSQDGKTANTWQEAQKLMMIICTEHGSKAGYSKTKICVTWQDGQTFEDRIDCGHYKGDFNATRQNIGEYLKNIISQAGISFEDETPETQPASQPAAIIPELSTTTFADLFSTPPAAKTTPPAPTPAPDKIAQPAAPQTATDDYLTIVNYSPVSFAIIGTGTKDNHELLRSLGGRYNAFLKCGKGWIFSIKRLPAVREALNI